MLIVFGGLPASGKTTIARELASQLGACYIRIHSIEQTMRNCGPVDSPLDEAGYRVAYVIAEDNLRIGRTVIADSVNGLTLTRDAWIEVAQRSGVTAIEIEVWCSDPQEHRRRVETRTTDIPGLKLPSWSEVMSREYHSWPRDHTRVDTAGMSVEENVTRLREILATSASRAETKSGR